MSHIFAKKPVKITAYILLCFTSLYFIFMFSYGGFGRKEAALDPNNAVPDDKLLFAHRGIDLYYPESCELSIDKAKDAGFAALEIDIRRDKNGELIVFHDDFCDRLLGIKGEVDTMTYKDLKKYPLLYREEKFDTNVYMITLRELLDKYSEDFLFYFDMKLTDFKTAEDMVAIIKEFHIEKHAIIANSDILFVFYLENKHRGIATALEGFDSGKEWTYYLMPKMLKPDFYASFYWNIDTDHIAWLKKNELMDQKIAYGMVPPDIKPMMDFGISNMIVDFDSTMLGNISGEDKLRVPLVK
ncbi:hypothetical protein CNR22_24135 [Sphingobacteriaceae bacterium]|nr:hypothetical protein CNR22_24135 [Sphingobacteriaceae bacterium]